MWYISGCSVFIVKMGREYKTYMKFDDVGVVDGDVRE